MHYKFSSIRKSYLFIYCAVIGDRFIYKIKFNINLQTHHSINTANKLVPGMFHRIFLLSKNVLFERQKHVDFRISRIF